MRRAPRGGAGELQLLSWKQPSHGKCTEVEPWKAALEQGRIVMHEQSRGSAEKGGFPFPLLRQTAASPTAHELENGNERLMHRLSVMLTL